MSIKILQNNFSVLKLAYLMSKLSIKGVYDEKRKQIALWVADNIRLLYVDVFLLLRCYELPRSVSDQRNTGVRHLQEPVHP